MLATHTPGPWKVGGDGMTIYTDAAFDFKPMVASTSVPDLNLADCRANARLIAAAPALLAALDGLCNTGTKLPPPEAWKAARAALAAARGAA